MTQSSNIYTAKTVDIEPILKQLLRSTEKSWYSGDLDDWSEWALKMRDTINASVVALRSIAAAQPVPAAVSDPNLEPSYTMTELRAMMAAALQRDQA